MDELGTILRETREARGQTVDEVAQVTRIRPRYLDALEEGRYDVLPTPVHVRGFLRNYAIHLGLEPDPLIARYNASRRAIQDIPLEQQVRPDLGRTPTMPPETLDAEVQDEPVFYRPLGASLQTPAWFSSDILIGAFVVVVLLAFVAWAGARFVVPAISEARASETPLDEGTGTGTPQATSPAAAVVTQSTQTVAAVTIQPTIPPIVTSVGLELTIVERGTWLKVEVDGQVVQEGMTNEGDIFVWDGAELVKVLTGNGAGVDVTLNGQNLGRLGARGEVVEKIWGLAGEIEPTPGATTPEPEEPTPEPTEAVTAPQPTEAAPTEAAPTAEATAEPAGAEPTEAPTEPLPEATATETPAADGG